MKKIAFNIVLMIVLCACGTIKIVVALNTEDELDLIIGLLFLVFAKLMQISLDINDIKNK